MKKLTNIKLINWHRFVNPEPIHVDNATLLSGENGAGKTTLLDAIQYVLLASSNSFNSAAHLSGKRKVTTYVRSKVGKESAAFERTGAISAHIALEFLEEKTGKYFVIGAVIDSNSENQEQTVRYIIDDATLEDLSFMKGDAPRSISEFRTANSVSPKKWYKTQREARSAIANKLGRLERRFFDLIPKAVAFKPIDDIKDFVYTYVLDEKSIDIEDLQDTVQNYNELERILNNAKRRLQELEAINDAHEAVRGFREREKKYEFYVTQAKLDLLRQTMDSYTKKLVKLKNDQDETYSKLTAVESDQSRTDQLIDDLKVEMSNNEEFVALENQKRRFEDLSREKSQIEPTIRDIKRNAASSVKDARKIIQTSLNAPIFEEYIEMFENVTPSMDIVEAKEIIDQVIQLKKEKYQELGHERFKIQETLNQKNQELRELNKEIELLKHNQRSYPRNTTVLYENLKDKFDEIGKKSEPMILCETLDIKDEAWRNAVEGYLNTQRFYILVNPEDYDFSLAEYDYLRSKRQAYGVGLINAADMAEYDTAPEGTLASVVSSKNIYARRYINKTLGKVRLCEDKNDLKKYPAAITKECMKYQNRVASAIKPEIFETPWIGQQSYRIQLKKAQQRKKELTKEIRELEKVKKSLDNRLSLLGSSHEEFLKYNLDSLSKYQSILDSLDLCHDAIASLERNQTIIQKRKQLIELQQKQRELKGTRDEIIKKTGMLAQQIQQTVQSLEEAKEKLPGLKDEAEEAIAKAEDNMDIWEADYKKSIQSIGFDDFIRRYSKQINKNKTQMEKAEKTMVDLMTSYKYAHDFGAPATFEGYEEFENAYIKLKSSEILEYEDKVLKARENAEIEFKEQFLSKLQENIKEAQSEFRRLNLALKDIKFSSESYKFVCRPGREKRPFYDMIMDPGNVGVSVFSGPFYDKHKEEIRELFNQLTQEEDDRNVETFTDYRNYLDFDIEITHEDGSISVYSKVAREKSGGETQTPFYVAIAASFVQLYGNSISDEAAGIVMFDEAFNNMDDERIAGVLKFMRQLPLQIIIAAPPDKIQYIAPYTDETVLVTTSGGRNFLNVFSNSHLQEAIHPHEGAFPEKEEAIPDAEVIDDSYEDDLIDDALEPEEEFRIMAG